MNLSFVYPRSYSPGCARKARCSLSAGMQLGRTMCMSTISHPLKSNPGLRQIRSWTGENRGCLLVCWRNVLQMGLCTIWSLSDSLECLLIGRKPPQANVTRGTSGKPGHWHRETCRVGSRTDRWRYLIAGRPRGRAFRVLVYYPRQTDRIVYVETHTEDGEFAALFVNVYLVTWTCKPGGGIFFINFMEVDVAYSPRLREYVCTRG